MPFPVDRGSFLFLLSLGVGFRRGLYISQSSQTTVPKWLQSHFLSMTATIAYSATCRTTPSVPCIRNMSCQNITSTFNRNRILVVSIPETSITILCYTSPLASNLAQVLELRTLSTQRDMSVLSTLMTYYSFSIWTRLHRQEFSTCSLELFDFGGGV
jgi:hypothetical protein